MRPDAVRAHAVAVAGWAAAAIGFSLPISTTLDGILLVVALAAWTVGGKFKDLPALIRRDPLVLLLPGFFVVIALGMTHGVAPIQERGKALWKYDDFLLPFLLVPLFLDEQVRRSALWGFGSAMALTLAISLLLAGGWTAPPGWFHGNAVNATVFRHQITHNLFMAFAALLFAVVAARQVNPWRTFALGLLALGAVADVLLFVQGRTGQVVLIALMLFWGGRLFGLRGFVAGSALAILLVGMAYGWSPTFHDRVQKTFVEFEQAKSQVVAPELSSVGVRVEWYRHTIELIAAHPVVGVGTGSFRRAYAEAVEHPEAVKPTHPHNQYLLTAVELGVGGAVLLVGVFGLLSWGVWRIRDNFYAELAQGMIILIAIGCVVNSLLVDHTEGLFFGWMTSMALAVKCSEATKAPC